MLNSSFQGLCKVNLPYKGRQHYMHSFDASNVIMHQGYEDYEFIVATLLDAAGIQHGMCHMTVDEKIVKAGHSQRRPKPHVDGCFVPVSMVWGHPGWNHGCNNVPTPELARMRVIVVASAEGCKVYPGHFHGDPKQDGDLSHIQDQLGEGIVLPADEAYLLSSDCVHESMILPVDTQRTFLRIALPN